jgi:hypothetical protein
MLAYLQKQKRHIVEYCLVQHPDLDVLYPGSINTNRVITELVTVPPMFSPPNCASNGGHGQLNNGGMMTRVDTIPERLFCRG